MTRILTIVTAAVLAFSALGTYHDAATDTYHDASTISTSTYHD